MTTLQKDLLGEIKENIKDYEGTYICDLINEMYNTDYYIIGTWQAKEFLKNNMDELFETLENYKDNFGEQYPNIQAPEKLASLIALMQAEEVFTSLDTVNKYYNDILEEDNINEIIEEIDGLIQRLK